MLQVFEVDTVYVHNTWGTVATFKGNGFGLTTDNVLTPMTNRRAWDLHGCTCIGADNMNSTLRKGLYLVAFVGILAGALDPKAVVTATSATTDSTGASSAVTDQGVVVDISNVANGATAVVTYTAHIVFGDGVEGDFTLIDTITAADAVTPPTHALGVTYTPVQP